MTTSSQTDCNCKKSVGERDETLSLEQHYLAAWVPRSFTILCHFYCLVVSRLLREPLVSPLSSVLFSFFVSSSTISDIISDNDMFRNTEKWE